MRSDDRVVLHPWVCRPAIPKELDDRRVVDRKRLVEFGLELELPLSLQPGGDEHENAFRAAQARNDRTQMVVSQPRAAEAQALLDLAQTQLERSQLVAPFDGIVIKGDLTQNLGAPVKKGEVLMVLSPSDNFRLIVEVDETDIAAVRAGQHGALALAARPDQALAFTTRRIVPLATAADGRNYFEVEASLDAAQPDLRPGLSGIAKIEAGYRPLAWLLFHRAADWLRLAVWTLGP